jgi:hypothetical protein
MKKKKRPGGRFGTGQKAGPAQQAPHPEAVCHRRVKTLIGGAHLSVHLLPRARVLPRQGGVPSRPTCHAAPQPSPLTQARPPISTPCLLSLFPWTTQSPMCPGRQDCTRNPADAAALQPNPSHPPRRNRPRRHHHHVRRAPAHLVVTSACFGKSCSPGNIHVWAVIAGTLAAAGEFLSPLSPSIRSHLNGPD